MFRHNKEVNSETRLNKLLTTKMELLVKIQLLTFCSTVLNSVFLALGVSVAGCGVWILFDNGSFMTAISSDELRMVGTALLLIGGVVMAVSVVGFLGTRSENRFLLLMYLGGLLVLLLGQLFVLLLLVFNKYQLEDSLDTAVDGMILHYGNNHSRQDRLLDNLQQHGMCCGRTGNSDWLKNSFIQTFNLTGPFILPCSCFSSYHRGNDTPWCSELLESRRVLTGMVVGPGNDPYHQGCRDKLIDWLQENTLTIAGMDVSLIVVQVLQAVLGLSLYRTFGQKAASKRTNPQVDADSAHPDSTTNSHFAEQSLAYVDTEWEDTESTHPELHHGNPLACHLDNQSHIDSS